MRRSVTTVTRRSPLSVRIRLKARRSLEATSRSREINPFVDEAMHKRVTPDDASPSAVARSPGCAGPCAARTTRARSWGGVVISSATPANERAATATKTRLAVSTVSAKAAEGSVSSSLLQTHLERTRSRRDPRALARQAVGPTIGRADRVKDLIRVCAVDMNYRRRIGRPDSIRRRAATGGSPTL